MCFQYLSFSSIASIQAEWYEYYSCLTASPALCQETTQLLLPHVPPCQAELFKALCWTRKLDLHDASHTINRSNCLLYNSYVLVQIAWKLQIKWLDPFLIFSRRCFHNRSCQDGLTSSEFKSTKIQVGCVSQSITTLTKKNLFLIPTQHNSEQLPLVLSLATWEKSQPPPPHTLSGSSRVIQLAQAYRRMYYDRFKAINISPSSQIKILSTHLCNGR